MGASQSSPEQMSSIFEPYVYSPLHEEHSYFRLLTLHRSPRDASLFGTLSQHTHHQPPDFEALSYTWGSRTVEAGFVCDGKLLKISKNLHDVLQRLAREGSLRVLWIDQICIMLSCPCSQFISMSLGQEPFTEIGEGSIDCHQNFDHVHSNKLYANYLSPSCLSNMLRVTGMRPRCSLVGFS
jgi:hypothetical protein